MKEGHHPRQISCSPLTTLLMVIFTLRKSKQNRKILQYVFLFFFLSGMSTVYTQCVCALMVILLHTETFYFDPVRNSRPITDSDVDQIK